MTDFTKDSFLEQIRSRCPEVVTRRDVERLTFGLIKAKTIGNKDSLGEGPSSRINVGKKVAYPREAFLAWLEERLVVEHA